MNTFRLDLDLDKGARGYPNPVVRLRKGDKAGTTIVATIYDHGTKLTTSGLSASMEMLLPDGTHYYRAQGTYSSGVVTVQLDESHAASVTGDTSIAYIRLYQGETVIASTEPFAVRILRSAVDEGEDPAESYDDIIPIIVRQWLAEHPEATTTVQDNSLTTAKYQDSSVTTAKIANSAITSAKIADGAVGTNDLANNAVTSAKIADGGVATEDIADEAVTDAKLADNSVTTAKIANNAVTSGKIADGAVGTNDLADNAVTNAKIASGAVTTDRLADGSVSTAKLGNAQVTTDKLAGASVVAGKIANNAVTTPKLADESVTDAKLSPTGIRAKVASLAGNVLRGTRSGAVVTASDAYAAPPLGLTVDGKSVQDGTPTPSTPVAIDSVESVGVKFNRKNLLPHPPAYINTDGGVTFTDNGDGSYTINGTATKNTYIYVTRKNSGFTLPAGTYTLSARSADGTMPSDLFVGASRWNGSTNTNYGYKKGGDFTFTHDGTGEVQVLVYLNNTYTVSNATVYPQLELGSSGTSYVPWTTSTTPIDLQGHELRSLPDGTHDELTVDADGNVTLVQRVGSMKVSDLSWSTGTDATGQYFKATVANSWSKTNVTNAYFEAFVPTTASNVFDGSFAMGTGSNAYARMLSAADVTAFLAAVGDTELCYALDAPQTIDLGTVTLPKTPAPDLTAWAVTDPSTAIALDYERDLTIAIGAIEAAIADLATS